MKKMLMAVLVAVSAGQVFAQQPAAQAKGVFDGIGEAWGGPVTSENVFSSQDFDGNTAEQLLADCSAKMGKRLLKLAERNAVAANYKACEVRTSTDFTSRGKLYAAGSLGSWTPGMTQLGQGPDIKVDITLRVRRANLAQGAGECRAKYARALEAVKSVSGVLLAAEKCGVIDAGGEEVLVMANVVFLN
jgi:hypothetical protein